MPRIELRDGQWADVREHITHGEDKTIKRAQWKSRDNPEQFASEGDTVALKVFIRAWSVNDEAGKPIPLEDPDAIDRMPSDIADDIAVVVNQLYHPEATVPNPRTPSSSSS
jgi:hypothetical protein